MIAVETAPGCTILRLNRPEKANALTSAMLEALIAGLDEVTTPVLILTGTGTKAFSAGADLNEAHNGLATSPLWEQLSAKVAALPCLTIAALNGTLAGGAFGMSLACDLRIAVSHAKLFYPVARLGFLPPKSDPKRMQELIGPARTKAILMAGMRITAETAQLWGLVDDLQDDPLAAAKEIAARLDQLDPDHLKALKTEITRAGT